MSAIEYAKKYAGMQFYLSADVLPPGMNSDGYRNIAHIVGYLDDSRVVMEFYDPKSRQYCWPLHDDVTLVLQRGDFYDKKYPMVLAVDYRRLQKPQDPFERISRTKPLYIPDTTPPYPAICKSCKAPARTAGKFVMCSNRACTSRTKLLKTLNIKPTPKISPILCPHRSFDGSYCHKKAVGFAKASSKGGFHVFYCEMGHKFNVNNDALKVNDVVLLTLGGNDHNDRIWDGTKWEIR